ncbi:MAG: hypothetical protein EP329_14140 [Deltaproteobacteria bacterium]|nr:MAG: hypothetical protein EP329_14140 [Deltaproteobacteria bacterium]
MKRRIVGAVVWLAAMSLAIPNATARDGGFSFADAGFHLLNGRWAAVSPFFGAGPSQLGRASQGLDPRVVGLRYSERKGHVTGVFFALLNSVAGGLAASSPKSVETWREGNYIVTRTTYRSEAEKQEMLRQTQEANDAMLAAEDQSADFEVYMTRLPGGGEVSGFKLNMFFGAALSDSVMLDIGMGFGSATSRFERDGRQTAMQFSYWGMPLKLNVAAGPMLIWFQWDWNWLGTWTDHSPGERSTATTYQRHNTGSHLELGVTTVVLERLMVQASVTTPEIDSLEFGFRASVGLRF